MTRAHIEVVVTLSLDEAQALYDHLDDNVPDGSETPAESALIAVYNGLHDVMEQARQVVTA